MLFYTRMKNKYEDDGHTIYNMDVDGLPKRDKKVSISVDRKERRLLIKAGLKTYMPICIGLILCFTLAILLIYLWLR